MPAFVSMLLAFGNVMELARLQRKDILLASPSGSEHRTAKHWMCDQSRQFRQLSVLLLSLTIANSRFTAHQRYPTIRQRNDKARLLADGPIPTSAGFVEVGDQVAQTLTHAEKYRRMHEIVLKGDNHTYETYDPVLSLDAVPIASGIRDVFSSLGHEEPTPVQAQSWPILLEGRDMVSIAKTGSGKTFAYLMPAFHKFMVNTTLVEEVPFDSIQSDIQTTNTLEIPPILAGPLLGKRGANLKKLRKRTGCHSIEIQSEENPCRVVMQGSSASVEAATLSLSSAINHRAEPSILILVPTRELASQIEEEAQKFTRIAGLRAIRLIGGGSQMDQQIFLLRSIRPQMIIATPGRCLDLASRGELVLSNVQYLVLDEADRMLQMGQEKQLRELLTRCSHKGRQTLMFSATWPQRVRALSNEFLRTPVILYVGSGDGNVKQLSVNKNIRQHVKILKQDDKEDELFKLLGNDPASVPKTVIFASQWNTCNYLADVLEESGFKVDSLHSRIRQHIRTKIMGRFRKGELSILVATDVASRGLDVIDVERVINFDMPVSKEKALNYVHRIGRTGRGEQHGVAHSFFTRDDWKLGKELVQILEQAEQEVPDDLRRLCREDSFQST